MIKEIKIENFKSIQSLNLELGRLNVFIGANGSGKSNILEAIAMGSAAIDNKLEYEFLGTRLRVTSPNLMKSAFDSSNKNDAIKIAFKNIDFEENKHEIELILTFENKWVSNQVFPLKQIDESEMRMIRNEFRRQHFFTNLTSEEKTFNLQYLNELEEVYEKLKNEIEKNFNVKNFLIFSPENNFLRNFNEETYIRPLGVRGEGLFNHIVEIFKEKPVLFKKINENLQLLDWFDGFEIPNDLMFTERRIKIKDRFLEDGLQYFDQRSANEGFLYLLFYLTLFISDETPKFFAIDNIDNAMNPKMGDELVHLLAKLAKEHDKQVILTTHNPSVLDGLDLSDDDQRLFVISRNKKGHTQALRVPHRESDERLSYRFIRGSIGGLPKNF